MSAASGDEARRKQTPANDSAPGKQLQLVQKAQKKLARFWVYAMQCAWAQSGSQECAIEPLPQDKRFRGDAWRQWPFNVISQSFLFTQQ